MIFPRAWFLFWRYVLFMFMNYVQLVALERNCVIIHYCYLYTSSVKLKNNQLWWAERAQRLWSLAWWDWLSLWIWSHFSIYHSQRLHGTKGHRHECTSRQMPVILFYISSFFYFETIILCGWKTYIIFPKAHTWQDRAVRVSFDSKHKKYNNFWHKISQVM